MAGLRPLLDAARLAWYRWALREIDPLHPDVPEIVHRVNELENGHA